MSVQAMSYVIKHSNHKGGALLTLLMIANYAGADGADAWPSIAVLAQDTRMSERSVQRHILELVESAELIVEVGGGRGLSSSYVIAGLNGDNPGKKGDKIAPIRRKKRVTIPARKGDISGKPSYREPSLNHPEVKTRPQKCAAPSEFAITDERWEKARQIGWKGTRERLEVERDKFLDYWLSTGEHRIDWEATWRNWVRKAIDFGSDQQKGGSNNGTHKQGGPQLQTEDSVRSFRPGLWEAAMEEPGRAPDKPH